MKNDSLISVIVPIYNSEIYLRKCLDSLINQTFSNLEIILVDDGSTDSSPRICDEYAKKDPRVIVYHQKNTGQAGARNLGLDLAKGDFIGFVDSDDWVALDMYEVLLNALKRNDADISICGRYSVIENVISESKAFKMNAETTMDRDEAIRRFFTYKAIDSSSCDKLYKKEILANIRYPSGYICEDVPFVYQALKKTTRCVHCARPLYYCLHREGSTSRSRFSKKTMGLYYNFATVYYDAKDSFPYLSKEFTYLYLKNLLVLAYIMASEKQVDRDDRAMVNAEIRKNATKIIKSKFFKRSYKLLVLAIQFRVEKLVIKIAKIFGLKY